jgi:hypothetical protein
MLALYLDCFIPQGSSFSHATYFLSVGSRHFTMSSKRKEYHVDCRAKKAALFFLACEANPAMRLSLPAAMRAKGYSDVEATDRILVQQVHRESQKKAPKDTPRPESAAASSLLALATVATTARQALRSILTKQMVAPIIVVGGIDAVFTRLPRERCKKHHTKSKSANTTRGSARPYTPRPARMRPLS